MSITPNSLTQQQINIYNFLKSLDEDINPSYTNNIEAFINNCTINSNELEKDHLFIFDNEDDKQIIFNAFYSLTILYRKDKNISKLLKIVDRTNNRFNDKPLFLYIRSYIHKNKLTKRDALQSIELASEAIDLIEKSNKNYPGFYQNYADAIAIAFENKLLNDKKLLTKGIKQINIAIAINPEYAKYYYTLGRLLILCEEYDEAKQNLLIAIDYEDPTNKAFSIRISEYQDALMKCSVMQTLCNYEKSKKEIEDEINNTKKSILEFLGFFAAILALVLTTVQIAVTLSLTESIKLIGFMLGGIIVAFGTLRLVMNFNGKTFLQTLTICLFGVGFVLFVLFIAPHFK